MASQEPGTTPDPPRPKSPCRQNPGLCRSKSQRLRQNRRRCLRTLTWNHPQGQSRRRLSGALSLERPAVGLRQCSPAKTECALTAGSLIPGITPGSGVNECGNFTTSFAGRFGASRSRPSSSPFWWPRRFDLQQHPTRRGRSLSSDDDSSEPARCLSHLSYGSRNVRYANSPAAARESAGTTKSANSQVKSLLLATSARPRRAMSPSAKRAMAPT
jgi:hypothetical protein